MSKIQEKANQNQKRKKDKYKVVNWNSYNQALKSRGSLTVWLEEDLAESWYDQRAEQRGGQYKYSETCIIILYQLRVVYSLQFRQLEGFTQSLFQLMNVELQVPSYSQICRRGKELNVNLALPKSGRGLHLVIDSTGLKVYGEGELPAYLW